MGKQAHANHQEFLLVGDSFLFKFLVRLRLIQPDREPLFFRTIFLVLLTWLPLLVLSSLQGLALGGNVHIPFLKDIAESVRLLLALPILIVAERAVGSSSSDVLRHFAESPLVADDDGPKYQALVRQIRGLMNSVVVVCFFVPLVIVADIFLHLEFPDPTSTWRLLVSPSGMTRTPAGWWHLLVSIPVFQFLVWLWLYRYIVWCWFLWRVSRLDLRLVATHPDQAGGLAFLGVFQVTFCPVIFALASVISAYVGQEVIFGGIPLKHYTMTILGIVLLLLIIFLGPYFVFSLKLFATMQHGLLIYGKLADDYTGSFERKWIGGEVPEGEPLLGSNDIQSLADLANSFAIIRNMHLVPLDLRAIIIPIVAGAVLPFLPLALTVFPFNEIVEKLFKILL